MKSGKRNVKVSVQRYTVATNGYGEDIADWNELGTAMAAVFYGTGSERRAAGREHASQTASFEVNANAVMRSLTTLDRLVVEIDGSIWDITAVSPISRQDVAITGVKSA